MPKAKADSKEPKATRSRTGCLTCRQRKIKCDEQFNKDRNCGNCTRLKRVCLKGTHISFRNEQNPSFQKDPARLTNFYSYRNTFDPDTHWQHVPPIVDFVQVEAWKITGDDGNEYLPGKEPDLSRLSRDDSVLGQPVTRPGQVYDARLHALSEAAIANQQNNSVYYQDQSFQPAYQAAPSQPILPQDNEPSAERVQNDGNQTNHGQQHFVPPQQQHTLAYQQHQATREQQSVNQQRHSGMSEPDMIGLANPEVYPSFDDLLRDAAVAASSHIDPNLEPLSRHAAAQMSHNPLAMDEVPDLASFLGHHHGHGGGGGG